VKKLLIILGILGAAILPAAAFASTVNIDPSSGSAATVTIGGTDGANQVDITVTGLGVAGCVDVPVDGSPIDMNDLVINCYGQGMDVFGESQSFYTVYTCNTAFEGQTSNCDDTEDPAFASANFQWVAEVIVPPAGVISTPEGFAGALTANVGDQLGDQGTELIIGVAAGVPLAFYVMKELIALMARRRAAKS